jgi:hypothetical protein
MFATMQVPQVFSSIKQGVNYFTNDFKAVDNALDILGIKPYDVNASGSNVLSKAKGQIVRLTKLGQTDPALVNAIKTLQDSPLMSRIVSVSKRFRIDPASLYKGFTQDLTRLALPAPEQTISRKVADSFNEFFSNPLKYVENNAGLSIRDVSKNMDIGRTFNPDFGKTVELSKMNMNGKDIMVGSETPSVKDFAKYEALAPEIKFAGVDDMKLLRAKDGGEVVGVQNRE